MQDEVRLNRILSQLEEIRREVKSMLPQPKPEPKPMPAPKAETSTTPVQKPALPASDPAPTTMERFWAKVEDWFLVRGAFAPKGVTREFAVATRWLTRVGSVLLAGAVAYFLMLAIDKGWIGPAQRVYGMMAWGVAGTAFGTWLKLKSERYGILGEVCAAVGLVAVYLSFGLGHRFFKPPVIASGYFAFAGLFAATAAAGVLSVRLKSLMIACLALAGGFLVPTICSFANHDVQLHVYLLVLSAGATVVAVLRGWTLYGFASIAVAFGMGRCGRNGVEAVVSYVFVVTQFAQFMTLSVRAAVRADKNVRNLIWVAAAVMSFASLWFSSVIVDNVVEFYGWHCMEPLHCLAWAAGFAALAVLSRRRGWGGTPVLTVFAFASATFGILSMCVDCWHFGVPTVLFVFCVFSALLAEFGARSGESTVQVLAVLLTIMLSMIGLPTFIYDIGHSTVNGYGYALHLLDRVQFMWPLPPLVAFLGWRLGATGFLLEIWRKTVYVVAGALAFVVVTGECYLFGHEYLAFLRGGFVTIMWSAIASAFLSAGIVRRIRAARHVGLGLLAASVVKLLLFDTSTLATPGRVGVFAAVGVLLIAGAFLYLKFKSRFEE